jgi:predicted secreted protein
MNLVSAVVVFLLIWWVILFTTLPIGVQQNRGDVETGIKAAPDKPMMKKKLIITTAISFVIWVIVVILIETDVISFREMAKGM